MTAPTGNPPPAETPGPTPRPQESSPPTQGPGATGPPSLQTGNPPSQGQATLDQLAPGQLLPVEARPGHEAAGQPGPVPLEEKVTVRVLRAELGDLVLEVTDRLGDLAIRIRPEALLEAARLCRDHPALDYSYLMDIATVDYLGQDPRFEVVYILYSLRHRHRVRLRVRVSEDEPVLDSLMGVWVAADWFEREAWDLMGIRFRGHPNLTRILTHAEFVGHALRKDYHAAERHRLSRTYDLFTEASVGAPPSTD